MLLKLKTFPLGFLPLLAVSLVGCNQLSPLGHAMAEITPIGELKYSAEGNPTVKIRGQVGERAPFLDSGAYILQDTTGSVWVRTSQRLPEKGQELLIEATLGYQSIALENQEFGGLYLTEVRQIESGAHQTPPSVKETPFPTPSPPETVSPKPSPKPFKEEFLPHKENNKGS